MHLSDAKQSGCFIQNARLIRLFHSPDRSELQRLPLENRLLREDRAGAAAVRTNAEKSLILRGEEEEEDSEREQEEEYTEEEVEPYDQNVSVLKRGPSSVCLSDDRGKRQCLGPLTSHYHQPQTVLFPPCTLNVLLTHVVFLIGVKDLFSAQINRGISIKVSAKEMKHKSMMQVISEKS